MHCNNISAQYRERVVIFVPPFPHLLVCRLCLFLIVQPHRKAGFRPTCMHNYHISSKAWRFI